jgi:hypothetical protein
MKLTNQTTIIAATADVPLPPGAVSEWQTLLQPTTQRLIRLGYPPEFRQVNANTLGYFIPLPHIPDYDLAFTVTRRNEASMGGDYWLLTANHHPTRDRHQLNEPIFSTNHHYRTLSEAVKNVEQTVRGLYRPAGAGEGTGRYMLIKSNHHYMVVERSADSDYVHYYESEPGQFNPRSQNKARIVHEQMHIGDVQIVDDQSQLPVLIEKANEGINPEFEDYWVILRGKPVLARKAWEDEEEEWEPEE